MTELHFFPNGPSTGNFTANVIDTAGVPTNVLEAALPFDVKCDWDIDQNTANILGGTWHVDLYAESIGGGFEGRVGGNFENVVPGQRIYTSTIKVPANFFDNDPPVHPLDDNSAVYKMVVVLRHHNGAVTTSITALSDGPVVLVR